MTNILPDQPDLCYRSPQNRGYKDEILKILQRIIKHVYQNKVEIDTYIPYIKALQLGLYYGPLYTIIRQKLQQSCKNHKILITNSIRLSANNCRFYSRINQNIVNDQEQQNMKFCQIITQIIYHHFKNIADANILICQFWEAIKNNSNSVFQNSNGNQGKKKDNKVPQLKVTTLNLLTIKQLIPTSQFINLTDFRTVLQKLLNSQLVMQKLHIRELFNVYADSDLPLPQQNKEPITQPLKLQENIQEPEWLRKAKQNPIGKKLADRLGGKFCKNQDKPLLISQKIAYDIQNGLLSQKCVNYGLVGDASIQVIRTSQILKAYEQRLNQIQQLKRQQRQKKQMQKLKKEQTQQLNKQKKKKKKNKKKKTKTINSDEQIQVPRMSQEQYNRFQNTYYQLKQYFEYIKFIKDMKIDDSKRENCSIEISKIDTWKQKIKG